LQLGVLFASQNNSPTKQNDVILSEAERSEAQSKDLLFA
jgi:hypothetical protein